MTHTTYISDKAYQALVSAAEARGQTPEALIEDFALHQGHDPSQAWFWTPEWQVGERRADAEIAAGETEYFENEDDFLKALDADANV